MKRLLSTGLAALVAIAAVVLGSASPAAAETVVNQRDPISTTVFNDCTGESVLVTGSIHVLVNETTDGNGGLHFVQLTTLTGLRGTTSSGVKYVFNEASPFQNQFNALKGAASENTGIIRIVLVRQGSSTGGDNMNLLVLSHVTVDANGNIRSVTFQFFNECVG